MLVHIVDDSDINLQIFDAVVQRLGQDIRSCCFDDPCQALAAAAVTLPDLIIVDFMMPGLDGHEFVQRVRELPGADSVPIVMVTAAMDQQVRHRALDLGVSDFLTKPVSLREMKARLGNIVALRRAHLALHERNVRLAESEARFRTMADHAPVIVWVTEPDGRCTYVNRCWHELTGQAPGQGYGYDWSACVHPDDLAAVVEAFHVAAAASLPFRVEYRLRSADGGWRWVLDTAACRYGEDGRFLGYVGSCTDLHDRKAAEAAALEAAARSALALAAGRMVTWVWDALTDRVVWDEQAHALFDLSPGEVPPTGATFLALVHPGDRALLDEAGRRAAAAGEGFDGEYRIVLADGSTRWLAERSMALRDDAGRLLRIVGVSYDVTERKRSEERIRHLAHHDLLTDLPNRVLFYDRLERALAAARREGQSAAVLCIDLDRFKDVNDTLGHAAGDLLLCGVADRLRGLLREADTATRLGGDEFAILKLGPCEPEGADALARRVMEALRRPFDLDGHEIVIGASIGIAMFPGDACDGDDLLRHADLALYRAKVEGRDTHRFFEAGMNARLRARKELERDLRQALARGQLSLVYQPQIDLMTRRPVGVEALLRWHHPERGTVSPAEFVPLAEETGLILPIGDWVLRTACAQAARWAELRIAVNLSPIQFRQPRLVEVIADTLRATGLEPGRLELEITEGVLLQDTDATLAALAAIKALGVRIAMDDFGTGYSSLSYLRRFPFDKIKIDRSFIADLGSGEADAIVRAIIGLGRALGMRANAEGVETAEQAVMLMAEGCQEAQGYFFSKAVTAAEIDRLLLLHAPEPSAAAWQAA